MCTESINFAPQELRICDMLRPEPDTLPLRQSAYMALVIIFSKSFFCKVLHSHVVLSDVFDFIDEEPHKIFATCYSQKNDILAMVR